MENANDTIEKIINGASKCVQIVKYNINIILEVGAPFPCY